jgi:hypothetical protein
VYLTINKYNMNCRSNKFSYYTIAYTDMIEVTIFLAKISSSSFGTIFASHPRSMVYNSALYRELENRAGKYRGHIDLYIVFPIKNWQLLKGRCTSRPKSNYASFQSRPTRGSANLSLESGVVASTGGSIAKK